MAKAMLVEIATPLKGRVPAFDLLNDEGAMEFTVDRAAIAQGGWLWRLEGEGFVFNLAFENHAVHGPSLLVQRNGVASVATTKELPPPVKKCKVVVNWDRSMVQLVVGWGRWKQDTGRVPARMPEAPMALQEAAAQYDGGS